MEVVQVVSFCLQSTSPEGQLERADWSRPTTRLRLGVRLRLLLRSALLLLLDVVWNQVPSTSP